MATIVHALLISLLLVASGCTAISDLGRFEFEEHEMDAGSDAMDSATEDADAAPDAPNQDAVTDGSSDAATDSSSDAADSAAPTDSEPPPDGTPSDAADAGG